MTTIASLACPVHKSTSMLPLTTNAGFSEHSTAVHIAVVGDSVILVNDHHQAQLGSPKAECFATARLVNRGFARVRVIYRVKLSYFSVSDWLWLVVTCIK